MADGGRSAFFIHKLDFPEIARLRRVQRQWTGRCPQDDPAQALPRWPQRLAFLATRHHQLTQREAGPQLAPGYVPDIGRFSFPVPFSLE